MENKRLRISNGESSQVNYKTVPEVAVNSGELGGHQNIEVVAMKLLENNWVTKIAAIVQNETCKVIGQLASTSGASTAVSDVGELKGKPLGALEMIQSFDPYDENANIDNWLAKIDHLGDTHGWKGHEKTHFAQEKLQGAAKIWFDTLENCDMSWSAWKEALKHAFPRQIDFATALEELVRRRKLEDETMTTYYHTKLALCDKCGIKGEKAVSCIIHGLSRDLQKNAQLLKCKTPETLYEEFLGNYLFYYRNL